MNNMWDLEWFDFLLIEGPFLKKKTFYSKKIPLCNTARVLVYTSMSILYNKGYSLINNGDERSTIKNNW